MTREELKQFRSDLKKIGYKAKVQSFSDFSIVKTVEISTGKTIDDGNVFPLSHLEKHQAAFNLINTHKTMIIKD